MTTETGSLVVVVDSTSVVKASENLDALTAAGAKAEGATAGLGASATAATKQLEEMGAAGAASGATASAGVQGIAAATKASQDAMQAWLSETNAALDKAAAEDAARMAAREADMAGLDAATIQSIQNFGGISSSAAAASASVEKAAESSVAAAASVETVGAASNVAAGELWNLNAAVKASADDLAVYERIGGTPFAMPAQAAAEATVAIEGMGASMEAAVVGGEALTESVNTTKAAVNAFGETAEMAAARHKALAASYTAQAAAGGQIVESERSLAERAGARIEATAEQIAATQAAVAAQDAQMVSTEGLVGAQRASTVATEADTVATNVNTVAKKVNSRTQYELGIMAGELASGNIGRLKRSTAALANSTGLLQALMSPTGLAIAGVTAAIAFLGVEAYKAAESETELEQAITRSGSAAGMSAEQIRSAASQYATYYTSAKQVVAIQEQLMATGAVTASTFKQATEAAVVFGEATGDSEKQVIQVFDELSKNPLQTLDKINQQYGNITPKIRDHVVALIDEGDKLGAVAEAYQAIIDTMGKTADAEHAQEGLIDRLVARWKNGAASIGEAYAKLVNGLSLTDQFNEANATYKLHLQSTARNSPLDRLAGQVFSPEQLQAERAQVQTIADQIQAVRDAAALKGQSTDDNKAGTAADAYYDSHFAKLDKIKQKQKEINDLTATYEQMWEHTGSDNARLAGVQRVLNADGSATFTGGNFDKDLAGINAKFKPAKGPRGPRDPEVSAFSTFQGQVNSLQNAVVGPTDDAALAKYETGIAKLSDELNTYMAKSGDATKGAALFNEGQQALQKTLDKARASQKAADDAFDQSYAKKSLALQRSIDDQVNAIGQGTKEAAQTREVTKAYQDEADALADLAIKRQEGKLTQDQYDHDVQTVKRATDQNVATMQDGFKRIDAAQGNWLNGAKTAMQDYVDAGKNVAGLTQSFFTNSFDAMGNALANFATTGKLNFKSMVASILSDLAKMEMRIAMSKVLASMFGGGTDTSAGGGGAQMASIFDGGWGGIAMGGAFDSTGKITGFASGGVVDGATPFSSGGQMGVLGEAGPEAIMPLARGSDGKLGVRSSGGGGDVYITTSITVEKGGGASTTTSGDNSNAMAKQLAGMMESKAKEVVMRATQPGGILWKQRVGA